MVSMVAQYNWWGNVLTLEDSLFILQKNEDELQHMALLPKTEES